MIKEIASSYLGGKFVAWLFPMTFWYSVYTAITLTFVSMALRLVGFSDNPLTRLYEYLRGTWPFSLVLGFGERVLPPVRLPLFIRKRVFTQGNAEVKIKDMSATIDQFVDRILEMTVNNPSLRQNQNILALTDQLKQVLFNVLITITLNTIV
jgi:hypothetical protein